MPFKHYLQILFFLLRGNSEGKKLTLSSTTVTKSPDGTSTVSTASVTFETLPKAPVSTTVPSCPLCKRPFADFLVGASAPVSLVDLQGLQKLHELMAPEQALSEVWGFQVEGETFFVCCMSSCNPAPYATHVGKFRKDGTVVVWPSGLRRNVGFSNGAVPSLMSVASRTSLPAPATASEHREDEAVHQSN